MMVSRCGIGIVELRMVAKIMGGCRGNRVGIHQVLLQFRQGMMGHGRHRAVQRRRRWGESHGTRPGHMIVVLMREWTGQRMTTAGVPLHSIMSV
jgi:hypothetical protein